MSENVLASNATRKITTIGILGALGAVLMVFAQIPYPPVPFLKIEFSDVVVLLAFVLFGWKEAAFVGLLKAVVNAMVMGPVGPIAIGQISAFIASMSYVGGMYLAIHLRLASKRLITAILSISLVVFVMVTVNFFFVTPIYFGSWTYLGVQSWLGPSQFGLNGSASYFFTIIMVYVPFNLIKGIAVMTTFFIVERSVKIFLSTSSS